MWKAIVGKNIDFIAFNCFQSNYMTDVYIFIQFTFLW
jgi:hypothetical protein